MVAAQHAEEREHSNLTPGVALRPTNPAISAAPGFLTGGSETAEAAPTATGQCVPPALVPAAPILLPDPLVVALGEHLLLCPACRTAGRAVCPAGRSLGDVAYAAMQAGRAA